MRHPHRPQAQSARRERTWVHDTADLMIALGLTIVALSLLRWALEAGRWV